ncbi:hypothetical protein LTR27_012980 [Elasticomyces elasticus]|nr:hypothetical protein LTR27_012980 [Elasticomyces elasticus]
MKTSSMLTILALSFVSLVSARTLPLATLEGRGDLSEFVTTEAASQGQAPGTDRTEASLTKRTAEQDAIRLYNIENPHNRVPQWIMVNGYNTGQQARLYSQLDIWRAMVASWDYTSDQTATRPTANGRPYPTYFGGADATIGLPLINFGDSESPRVMAEFPLIETNPTWDAWDGGGQSVGPDRVLLDATGLYIGVITHRGQSRNGYHWGFPATDRGVFDATGGVDGGIPAIPPIGPGRRRAWNGYFYKGRGN